MGMPELAVLAIKVLLAAVFVALFSHLSSAFKPKLFSGLFAGAPIVAAISLAITSVARPQAAHVGALGMIAGAIGMVACCVTAALLVPRVHAIAASAAGWAAWGVVALGGYLVVLR